MVTGHCQPGAKRMEQVTLAHASNWQHPWGGITLTLFATTIVLRGKNDPRKFEPSYAWTCVTLHGLEWPCGIIFRNSRKLILFSFWELWRIIPSFSINIVTNETMRKCAHFCAIARRWKVACEDKIVKTKCRRTLKRSYELKRNHKRTCAKVVWEL